MGRRSLVDPVVRLEPEKYSCRYPKNLIVADHRCRAAAGHLPQNLAALSNAAISIVRVIGHFDYIPQANRHYAARPQDALDAILTPRQP